MRLVLFVVCVLAAALCSAAPNEWESIHPDGPAHSLGGHVVHSAVAPDGTAYLVSVFANLYARTDVNDPWTRIPATVDGADAGFLNNFLFDPANAQNIIANSGSGSVVQSTDGGQSWVTIYREIIDGPRLWLKGKAPSNPNLTFAWSNAEDAMYKSTDGGDTWTTVPSADMGWLRELVIDPADPDVLYGLDSQRVKKSTDGGQTWIVREDGLGTYWYMDKLVMHPFDNQTLFAGSGAGTWIHKTTDGALLWHQMGLPASLASGRITDLAIDTADPGKLYAGTQQGAVLVSANGGITWQRPVTGSADGEWIQIHALNDGTAMYTGDSGVSIVDTTGSFTRANSGFSDFAMTSFVCADDSCSQLYAGSLYTGFAVLPAGSAQWQIHRGDFAAEVRRIAVDPTDAEHLYIAVRSGLFESFDAGTSWSEIFIPGLGPTSDDMSMAPNDADVLFVQTHLGLMSTYDGGLTWSNVLGPEFFVCCATKYPIEISAADSQIVHVGTYNQGLYSTVDGGATWTVTSDLFSRPVRALAADPNDPQTLYLAESREFIWRSTDFGASWSPFTNAGLPAFTDIKILEVDPFVAGRLYLMIESGLLYVFNPVLQVWQERGGVAVPYGYSHRLQLDAQLQGRVLGTVSGQLFEMNLDTDLDGVIESTDNCTFAVNPQQRDTDGDSYGNRCDPDLNNDLVVNFLDLEILAERFFGVDPGADFNGDGVVNFPDLEILKSYFFGPPGPGAAGTR